MQSVINNPTQLSGREFSYTCYIKHIGKSSSRKLRWVIYYILYRMDPRKTCTQICLHNNLKNPKITRPNFHLGAPQKRKVMTKLIVCKRCRGISSSRKLRWVINYTLYTLDPQKTYNNTSVCATSSTNLKLHGPTSIWEQQKHEIM